MMHRIGAGLYVHRGGLRRVFHVAAAREKLHLDRTAANVRGRHSNPG